MSEQSKQTINNNQQPSILAEIKNALKSNKNITLDELTAILNGKGLSEFKPSDLFREFSKIKAESEPVKTENEQAKILKKAPNDSEINPDTASHNRIVAESIVNGPVNMTTPSPNNAGGRSK